MKYINRLLICWVKGNHTFMYQNGVGMCKHCEKIVADQN